jgi:hypothetical protein
MVRFAAQIKARGARVILETPAPLVRLMETAPGIDAVVARGATLPPFDLHIPVMSLPRALRLEAVTDIPADLSQRAKRRTRGAARASRGRAARGYRLGRTGNAQE